MKRGASGLFAAGLSLLLVLPLGAAAQQSTSTAPVLGNKPGLLVTRVFKKPPEKLTVSVTPYDDSDLNLRLKQDFEAQLAAQDRARVETASGAAYLLLFETEVVPADAVPRGPSLGAANVTESGVDVNVNVWSSSKDSVLGGRQQDGDVGSNVFHINAVLRDRGSGDVTWQGDAYYELSGPASERVARGMVAPLVQKLGQSVAHEAFAIE